MKLAIISHTEHYRTAAGTIVGWSPTVNEINHLLEIFDEIYHVAMLHEGDPPESIMPYCSDKVHLVPIKPIGGKSLMAKLGILVQAPGVIKTVAETLKKVDVFQLRTPTGIGVFLIPYLTLRSSKKGWFKYAGNWDQKSPPLGYWIQRTLLSMQSRNVTINGSWPNQPKQCITFENPCLTSEELQEGQLIIKQKRYNEKLQACYVGRLEKPKGVERIIDAVNALSYSSNKHIDTVHLVGDGPEREYFKQISESSSVNIIFHGYLSRKEVFNIYKKSHLFLMPTTASEGFPKVIAEAMNFGCLPVVSNVSAIGQYVRHLESGICMNMTTSKEMEDALEMALRLSDTDMMQMLDNQRKIVKKFTFKYYNSRIKEELLT